MCSTSSCSIKILNLLRSIQESMKCKVESNAQTAGLTTTQFMIMYEIYHKKGISLIDLSERLDLPKSSVSRIVDQLVNKGIIIREIPKENRRTVRLSVDSNFLCGSHLQKDCEKFGEIIVGDISLEKANKIIDALEELNSIMKSEEKPADVK